MEKKVIWIINQYVGSPLHGMEFRHYYLAKEFVQHGHEVVIISGSYSHLYGTLPKINSDFTFESITGITYCWVQVPSYERSVSIGRIWNMVKFVLMLRKFPYEVEKPHAIIVSSPSLFPITIAKRWAKKFKAKLIFEVRDIWPLTVQELVNKSKNHPLIAGMQWFERFAYKNSDAVVSVLPGAKPHMVSHGLSENKYHHIPNGIDLEELKQIKPLDPVYAELIPSGKFIVGYAGRIGIANALDYLIDAAKILKNNTDIHFVIVGNGNEKQNLVVQATKLPNVTFLDPIRKEQIQSLLAHFDVCYVGWRKEKLYRFGVSANKLYDYMYSGKPILHSSDAYKEPVSEANCGVCVSPEDPELIARGVLQLYNTSSEERSKMGENGHKYVMKNHTYSALAKNYMSVINGNFHDG